MIRKAKLSEIESILNLTRACAKAMIKNNIYQWNDDYPSHQAFEEDIKREELFVYAQGEKITGTIVISTLRDEIYEHVNWLTPVNTNSIYIHRLAVHPDLQGQGIAQQLMNFAESFAKENKYVSVRLDTFSRNPRNNIFYTKRGYQKLQEIYFPKQSKFPFYCYELVF
ncbi:GNAT family N-acetyltransferase [Leeuwenhoekiella sp. NPDC079379]|uniref:GNAT family N-acetyltransferase n=1 Tax=Leeuwenhoekiella sp. NPDC079379 TaxID=3364122 RepID=UPI0037C62414